MLLINDNTILVSPKMFPYLTLENTFIGMQIKYKYLFINITNIYCYL